MHSENISKKRVIMIIGILFGLQFISGCIKPNTDVIPINFVDFNIQYTEKYNQTANGTFTRTSNGEIMYWDNNKNSNIDISWFKPATTMTNDNTRWLAKGDQLTIKGTITKEE